MAEIFQNEERKVSSPSKPSKKQSLERKISNQLERKISNVSGGTDRNLTPNSPNDRKVSIATSLGERRSLERKISSVSAGHQDKKFSVSSGFQGLSISTDNVLLRESRSGSISAGNGINSGINSPPPHVPKKFIHTWRQACDKTKERTKDLIRRWRTLPEGSPTTPDGETRGNSWSQNWGWGEGEGSSSPHGELTISEATTDSQAEVWWRCRMFSGEPPPPLLPLAPEQRAKLAQLFNFLLDTDSDGLVSSDDFTALAERLREFAVWKEQGPHACMLREVVAGLLEAFLTSLHSPPDCDSPSPVHNGGGSFSLGLYLGLDDWLSEWSQLLRGVRSLSDLPLWLQYFPKILFAAINRSGTGVVSREELRFFYTSFLGFDSRKVEEAMGPAFDAMTANGDHPLSAATYQLIFANFLLGRHPNGPGQYMFSPFGDQGRQVDDSIFPVDYSALNSLPEDLEEYSPGRKSNRRSVIV